jgi:hypothetical protein
MKGLSLLAVCLVCSTAVPAQQMSHGQFTEIYRINGIGAGKKKPPPLPPPPQPFYFTNCSNPSISGNFVHGTPTSAIITLTYINGTGAVYGAFSSATVNGIKLSAGPGTLSTSTGSITFTASGAPISPGSTIMPISIGGSYACYLNLTVLNAPPSPANCTDPTMTAGATGCVQFSYRGSTIAYSTVRAADGHIWIQHNLGSPQVAVNGNDLASFGHYFQWGRWDDGGQMPGSGVVTGSTTLQKPSQIPSGNPNFISGSSAATSWWGSGGAITDSWNGTNPTTTNGKDPCTALGSGWHMPSAPEWMNVLNYENVFDNLSAFASNLKLTESGYRASANGTVFPNWVGGYYWTNTADAGSNAKVAFFDSSYPNMLQMADRGYGFNVRCMK